MVAVNSCSDDSLGKHSSGLKSPGEYNHIEELITLVHLPRKEIHDFPPCEIILAQKTSCNHGHQLDSMRFFRVIVGCRSGVF